MNDDIKYCIGNDPGEILGLYGPEVNWQIEVGGNVNKILAYIEADGSPWFLVYVDHKVSQRVNSRFIESVVYK